MLAQFDSFGNFEIPQITLCNPDGRALGILSNLSDRKMNIRFNDLSDLSFTIRRGTEDCRCPVYEQVEPFRYLLLEDIGYFVITDVSESEEGGEAFKTVEASSCEYELNHIQLDYYEGTYGFYSSAPQEKTDSLMTLIMEKLPSWRLDTGSIPSDVAARFRTFDTTDQTVYSFFMTEMEEAYECLFEFDILERVIRVYDRYQYDNRTDICLSTEDVLKGLTLRTKSDEIKTALTVKGGNGLDILSVNPLGTNMIYNFSYYATPDWMDDALIAKVQKWQADVAAFAEEETGVFPQKRAQINAIQSRKADKEGEITRLKQDLTNLQTQQSAIISEPAEQAQKNANLASVRTKINAAKSALSSAESALASIEAELKAANAGLKALQDQIALNAVFTPAEMEVLSRFIQQGAYTEENITRQDNMSYEEVQAQALELYKKAQSLLNTISTPRYEYSVETGSFIFQKEFAHLTNQLNSGCLIDIRLAEDDIASLLLLEMAVDYDGRGLSLTFGNRYKLSDPSALFNDLVGGSVAKTASTVEYLRNTFDFKQQRDELSELQKLKDESINLTHNMVVNADNQVMVIDASGISGRRAVVDAEFNPTGEFDPEVLKITNNAIAFSTDDFQTTETVLGKNLLPDGVTTPDGKNYLYGLNAKLLMGDLIIGENLKVSGEIEGRLINAKGLTVNNGVTDTLKVDENGDVSLNVKSLSITGNQVATQGDITSGLNSLKIGSRNYIKDSVSRVLAVSSSQYLHLDLCELEQNTQYTFSIEKIVRVAGTATQVSLLVYSYSSNYAYGSYLLNISNSKQEITFVTPGQGNYTLLIYAGISGSTAGNSIRYEHMKLEKGSKATDWTPAPDDPTYGVNMILNSKKEETSNVYGFAWKELTAQLIAGQKYTLSFCGHIDQQAKNDGKSLACYVYPSDWDTSGNTTLNTTYDSIATVSFVPRKTDTWHFAAYLFPSGGSRAGKVTLKWCKLEVGDRATDWTPAPEDRAYLVNTLSPTQADGMWLGSDGKLNITATQIKAGKLQSKDGSSYFDLENGKIVGKNAKMSGRFVSPGSVVSATLGNTEQIEVEGASADPGQALVFHPSSSDPFSGWNYLDAYGSILVSDADKNFTINAIKNNLSLYAYQGNVNISASDTILINNGAIARGELHIDRISSNENLSELLACPSQTQGYAVGVRSATGAYYGRKYQNVWSIYKLYHAENLQCGSRLITLSGSGSKFSGTASITFSPAFAKTPNVVVSPVTSDAQAANAAVMNITANGFTIVVTRTNNYNTTVQWIAVEPR